MAMLIVAGSSAVLSFDGLQKVALASRVPEHLAFLFPIAVDTTILMGSLAVLLYELVGVRSVFGWFTVMFGTVLSVTGNVISVADAGLIAQILHGIIPVLLCISLESLLRILRFNIQRSNKAHAENDQGTQSDQVEREENPPATIPPVPTAPVTKMTENAPVASVPAQITAEEAIQPAAEEIPASVEQAPVTAPEAPVRVSEPAVLAETLAKPAEQPAPVITEETPAEETPATESAVTEQPSTTEPVEKETAEVKKPVRKSPAKRTPAKKTPAKRAPAKKAPAVTETPQEAPVTPEKPVKTAPAKPAASKTAPLVQENVDKYKLFLESLPEGLDRNQKAREIRKAFPEATVTDIKAAILG